MRETDVSNKLKEYYEKRNYNVKECLKIGNNFEIDLYLNKDNISTGIEIKSGATRSQLNKAIIQILDFKPYVHYSYIATTHKPNIYFINTCKSSNIGIILVNEKIEMLFNPEINKHLFNETPILNFRTNKVGYYLEKDWLLIPMLIAVLEYENKTITSGFIGTITDTSQQTANRHLNLALEKNMITREQHGLYFSYNLTTYSKKWLKDISDKIQKHIN